MLTRISALARSITLYEILSTVMVSVVLGVFMWGWTFIYDLLKIFLDNTPVSYFTSGFWLMPGLLIPFIMRKPGLGLLASIVAAFVQGLITQWGLGAVIYGILQGAGAEIIFLLFAYRRFDYLSLFLAGLASAFLSYGYDYFKYGYEALGLMNTSLQLVAFSISSFLFAALPTFYLAKRLIKTGVMNSFLIVKKTE